MNAAAYQYVDFTLDGQQFRMSALEHEARYGRELSARLDTLMYRCRYESREPRYADLVAVRGPVPSDEKCPDCDGAGHGWPTDPDAPHGERDACERCGGEGYVKQRRTA